ncbi:MAG: regulatory iron-sulfur-containing complex subunit RicT [Polaribacter sp.]|uniref:PSP1 domain-containing protein n=1 Tax=Polaribacter sp. TaxID=1920175 RepID=UPI003BAE4401
MACGSCGTTENGVPKGCKSNGNCGTGTCGSGSEKLAVFDWLSNMTLPNGEERFNIFEVRFKNGRKHFFRNTENLTISMGDVVAVESSSGHDVGTVSLAGELVKVQMKKYKVAEDSEEILKIYRKASQRDIDVWQSSRDREEETQRKGREILGKLGLQMKLSDVEFQGDGNKATFYYTADSRVDFRQLIRDLASAFSIRVEMKQVGARQEAARLGGVGSCGRELCCSTWLTDFRKVTTSAARYQQLSLNPLKLAGQCGKLKCCLNFELDSYLDALKSFPKQDLILKTEKGDAVFVKMDIFKKHLWYTYSEERFKWFRLTLDQVLEIIELNKNNEKSISLEEYESDVEIIEKVDFEDAVGQDSLTRFDTPKKSNRRRNNKKKKPATVAVNQTKESPQKQQVKRKPRKNPNQKNKDLGNSNQANQPTAEVAKTNKPRKNNRNRNKNKPKNGNNSPEK